jgi:hypothetical protein
MKDGRWTFFGFVNYLLLAFYFTVLLFTFSTTAHFSGPELPILFELLLLFPPIAGIINSLFNRSIIHRNFRAQVPLSATKKTWQWIISLLHFAGYLLLMYQINSIIRVAGEDMELKSESRLTLLRVILLVYGILGLYITVFQLVVARQTGIRNDPEQDAAN